MVTSWSTGNIVTGADITKDHINELLSVLDVIRSGCNCNCNYTCTCQCNYACTCQCNYCTCTCNYACTCTCNYSDKNVKFNIHYLDI